MLNLETPQYAPLSQAMTDSESEEEIHNAAKHRQHLQKQQQSVVNSLALHQQHNQLASKFQQNGNGHPPRSYTTNMQNIRSVRHTTDINDHITAGSNFSSFNSDYDDLNHTDADNVAILGSSDSKSSTALEPMSLARRCCFVGSLLLCVFAVIGFVWVAPCGNTCPAPVDRVKTHNWLNNYTKIELKGGVNIVSGLRSWENNLIFLYRGDTFFPEFKPSNTKRNGIISLIGSSGAVAWYDEMVDEPQAIDCTLIDVDRNGRPDCIVIDEYGELGAINPLSGQWHWRFKERSAHKVHSFDFPIILPDMDSDGVFELLVVSSASLKQRTKDHLKMRKGAVYTPAERNFLLILSGQFGTPIGDGFQMHDCELVSNLQLEHAQTVSYTCVRNNTEAQRSKALSELFALITNKSIVGKKVPTAAKISQHHHYTERLVSDAQRNIYSLSGRELLVENRGTCPENCNVTLILSEMRNGKTFVLRNFTNNGMYGMRPVQWHFKHTDNKMSGFVMKFWKWNNFDKFPNTTAVDGRQKPLLGKKAVKANAVKDNQPSKANKQNQQNHSHNHKSKMNTKSRRKRSINANEFNLFDHLVTKRHAYVVGESDEISKKPASKHLLNNYNKMQMITETVILVLFIGADTRIENTSQSNIVQFCRHDINNEPPVCQPDLNNQENSMVIADLDQDGAQELVSYMSTFVQATDNALDWKLVTYVRLLRLQSELPAFYSKEQHN